MDWFVLVSTGFKQQFKTDGHKHIYTLHHLLTASIHTVQGPGQY